MGFKVKYLRKQLQGMVPYHSSKIIEGVVLNANESPFNLPKEVMEEIQKEITNFEFSRYPDTDNTILREALAKAYNISVEQVTCGVGSDELIDDIFKAVVSDNDVVLTIKPSFSMYKQVSKIHDAKFVEIDLKDDFTYDVDKVIEGIKEHNPKLIFLCSPNNPTGCILERNDLIRIIESTKSLVVVDEAYIEFSKENNLDLVDKYDNVILLRTFSKIYSLASMRCGYAISNKSNIDVIDTVKAPYNLNVMTQLFASVVIKNKDKYKTNIEYLVNERERLYQELLNLNIKVYNSCANFLWMELSEKIISELEKNKVYIRKLMYNESVYYRVSIGTIDENDSFLKVVRANA